MARLPALLFAVLLGAALAQAWWQYFHLPETVATRFDATGQPKGHLSRTTHTALHVGLVLGIAALLEGIARLNRRLPDDYINIPHRAQWLAPAHRTATHDWLAGLIRIVGCGVLAFLLGLFHQVYRANVNARALTASTTALVFGLFLTLGILSVCPFVRFWRPPPH